MKAKLIWQLGGAIQAIVWQGDYIYAAVGPRLVVIDASNIRAPRVVGQSDPLSRNLYSIVVDGDRGYGLTTDNLHVFDLSDPASPQTRGQCAVPGAGYVAPNLDGRSCRRLHPVEGGIFWSGPQVTYIDAADPDRPRIADLDEELGRHAAFRGSIAYVADSKGVSAFDISAPATPIQVGRVELPNVDGEPWIGGSLGGDVRDIEVVGDHLWYISGRSYADFGKGGSSPLYVIDVHDPQQPREVASFPMGNGHRRLSVDGDRAYACGGLWGMNGWVQAYDLSNPAEPHVVSSHRTGWTANGVAAHGNQVAYVLDSDNRVTILDMTTPGEPETVGELTLQGSGYALAKRRDQVFVGMEDGVHVLDVSRPDEPVDAWVFPMAGAARSVQIARDQVWAVNWRKAFVLDVSNPHNPTLADTLTTTADNELFEGLALGDRYACLLYGGGELWNGMRLHLRELAEPAASVQIADGALDMGVPGYRYVVRDGQLLAFWTGDSVWLVGLRGFPGNGPNWPRHLLPDSTDIVVADGRAYVLRHTSTSTYVDGRPRIETSDQVTIHDVAETSRFTQLGTVTVDQADGRPLAICVAADRLYLLGEETIVVIDVSTPATPVIVERKSRPRIWLLDQHDTPTAIDLSTELPPDVLVDVPLTGSRGVPLCRYPETAVLRDGDYLYVTSRGTGLAIYELLEDGEA